MNNPPSTPFMEKVSGAVSGALSDALDRQSPSLAAAKKYQERFLSKNRINSNCRVYISDEMFDLLNRMVAAVGKNRASVGNYVTEIVREHVERHRESINAIYFTNTRPVLMEVLLIVALLASNIYLIGKVLKRPAEKHPPAPATNSEETPSPASSGPDDDSLVGRSHYDMDRLNALIDAKVNSRVDEKVDEIVTRIRTELTSPEDVGLPPEEPAQPEQEKTIPQERLDEVFTHHTVGESFGDAPEITERQTGGQDFKALESAVRVAKDEPHTPEEAAAAKETLKEIQGTVIEERLSLDPKVRTRILSIIYGDEDEPLTKEVIAKKKVVYSKTIDTVDIDRINLNILT